MTQMNFSSFFQGKAFEYLQQALRLALDEDGQDLTSDALFSPEVMAEAEIVAKEQTLVAGLPLTFMILDMVQEHCGQGTTLLADEGSLVEPGTIVATIKAPARVILKAERVILNYICHLSGVANLTKTYVERMGETSTRLLDTRKTLPGLRHAEKYAVLLGGGKNHRMDLEQMLMLKDNHIDRAGGITPAVQALRAAYSPCPPIEVECRTPDEVQEAASLSVTRIMLDNMPISKLQKVLSLIPEGIETEVSGGVNLETITAIAQAGPDFVSVGRLTHSAPAADYSMRIRIA
ncbi:carboxylating nicotinate-nucleotide diphosphorylase [Desulfovibrio ferrophilus]|uniref:nicotinate-nucleotide diphosphorylase (carboxylating) n=1 Tax=Desulfovibrio ferrophilus TaxID=241368 RepID=A0A2Z6AX28_9BACT|nr:carboxylating nicotinate-nucleotide diphosphorylase [Desulfovibrio ferrophilus]BBD07758.1 nicotinate-nucleotide pyrophosphorylase [Desulfovibrio ferrophilus]